MDSGQVREFLAAHGERLPDGRWVLPEAAAFGSQPLFEPAALEASEICLLLGIPLRHVSSLSFALSMARRISVLESRLYALEHRPDKASGKGPDLTASQFH